MKRRPFATLTRHFVATIVSPPFLTELGVDYLRRTVASVLGILLVTAIFVTRAMFKKYTNLYVAWDEAAYLKAVNADTLMMIAIPMLILGLVTVVMSPMLFPDEVDYVTLSMLPLRRFELFAAKLAAVAIVASAAVVAVNLIAVVWFPVAVTGRSTPFRSWLPHSLGARVAAHTFASLAASFWIFSAVMALQGTCLAFVPSTWRRVAAAVVQSGAFLLLLLSIPWVFRIPAMKMTVTTMQQAPLMTMPPVWFLGLERTFLAGDAADAWLAQVAGWATFATVAVIAVTYAWLYRNAEALASHSGQLRATRAPVAPVAPVAPEIPQPTRAVLAFAMQGLTRSRLHYIVFLLIAGVGSAIFIGQLGTLASGDAFLFYRPRVSDHAVVAAPLVVALAAALALRAAFLLPLDRGAAWLFRITESPDIRSRALDAVAYVFTITTVIPSLLVAGGLQPYFLGGNSIASITLVLGANLILVEVLLRNWARVPFTCTYLPGKRVLAYNLGVLLATYFVFVYLGAHIVLWSSMRPARAVVVGAALASGYWGMRRSRLRMSGRQPLEFEDEDPLAIRTLNLLPDERH